MPCRSLWVDLARRPPVFPAREPPAKATLYAIRRRAFAKRVSSPPRRSPSRAPSTRTAALAIASFRHSRPSITVILPANLKAIPAWHPRTVAWDLAAMAHARAAKQALRVPPTVIVVEVLARTAFADARCRGASVTKIRIAAPMLPSSPPGGSATPAFLRRGTLPLWVRAWASAVAQRVRATRNGARPGIARTVDAPSRRAFRNAQEGSVDRAAAPGRPAACARAARFAPRATASRAPLNAAARAAAPTDAAASAEHALRVTPATAVACA